MPVQSRGPVAWVQWLIRWSDTQANPNPLDPAEGEKLDLVRVVPYIGVHLMCLGVFFVGFSWFTVGVAAALYLVRMFCITGFYHRYFSHKTFKTSRFFQFCMAAVSLLAVQRGAMWWAAHHRHHHRHSDEPTDRHSPIQHGFWYSHMLWFITKGNFQTEESHVKDLAKFRELRLLDRFDSLIYVVYGFLTFCVGWILNRWFPQLGTSGMQMLVWAFFVSTVVAYHATYTINSLAHVFGSRRFATKDTSRNNFFLALLTLGEGWHNNHHHYPSSVRQGFYWWEIDITYYTLKTMSWVGLIWDLQPVPKKVLALRRADRKSRRMLRTRANLAAPASTLPNIPGVPRPDTP